MTSRNRSVDFTAFYDSAVPASQEVVSLWGAHWRGNESETLVAVFRNSGSYGPDGIERSQEIALGKLGHRRALASALALGFVLSARTKAPLSRLTDASLLRPFFRFLDESDPEDTIAMPAQVDTPLVDRYLAWLSRRTSTARDGSTKPWSRQRKKSVYGQLRLTMDTLRRDGSCELAAECSFRGCPWPAARDGEAARRIPDPSGVLSDGELRAIHEACRVEVSEAVARFEHGERSIAEFDGMGAADGGGLDLAELGGLLSNLERRYGGVLPSMQRLGAEDSRIPAAIERHGGKELVLQHLVATPGSLLPFIILLAMRTFFNPDTLLGIKDSFCREAHWFWGNLDWELIAGDLSSEGREELSRLVGGGLAEGAATRLVLSSYKGRKHGMVTRSFRASSEWDSPSGIVTAVRRITARMRPIAPEVWRDRLFLFQASHGGPSLPRSFTSTIGLSSDRAFSTAKGRFIRRHGLPDFTLRSFRLTGADIVWEATGGSPDAVATMLGNEPRTASLHYCTPGNVKRAEHRLAVMTNRRVRMVETGGRSRIEFTACTPGFHCADPYDSPLPGQEQGRLCSAYPACATCPLASLDRSRPEAVAWLLSLAESIERAEGTMDPARWRTVYAPILAALRETWLPGVPAAVRDEAEAIAAHLPPSPEME